MCIIAPLLQKIRSLSKQYSGIPLPSKFIGLQPSKECIQEYIETIEYIKNLIIDMRSQQEQHNKLEGLLQRQQIEQRKHIRLEQQLKLYVESLKADIEESQKQRQNLLTNTKHIIKELKRQNQQLFTQLSHKIPKQSVNVDYQERVSNSFRKKTQLTERNHDSNSAQKKQNINSKRKLHVLSNIKKKKDELGDILKDRQQQITKKKNRQKRKHHISLFKIQNNERKKHNKSKISVSSLKTSRKKTDIKR